MAINQGKWRKITYKGEVTKIDYSLCQFQMDGIIEVYAGIFVSTKQRHMPLLNEVVILKNALVYDNTTLFLTKKSKIANSNNNEESLMELMSDYKQFLFDYKLKLADLIEIRCLHDSLNALQDEFMNDREKYLQINITTLLLDVLKQYLNGNSNPPRTKINRSLNRLPEIVIKVPMHFKPDSSIKELCQPPTIYWHMEIRKSNPNEVIIGLLNVSKKHGFLFLSDKIGGLPVVIPHNNTYNFSAKIAKILNHYVVIKKFRQISEKYKNIRPVKYVYADINDIHIIETTQPLLVINATENVFNLENMNYLFELKMYVINKSSVIEKENRRYCFLHAKYDTQSVDKPENTNLIECVFRITEELLYLHPVFNEGDTYCVYTNLSEFRQNILKMQGETLLTILNKRLQSYNLPADLKLRLIVETAEKIINQNDELKMHSVDEAYAFLKSTSEHSNKNLIHIEGIIAQKRFFHPYKKANIIKRHKFYPFGTCGKMVHNIMLRKVLEPEDMLEPYAYVVYENDECYENVLTQYYEDTFPRMRKHENVNINVYMHNFENLQCPLALLPQMRVIFKYVYAQKGMYFKPSIFTTVQIVSYEAEYDFSTASEILDTSDWGPQTYLGNGNDITTDCVCWSSTITIQIIELNIQFTCPICKHIISETSFSCCQQYEFLFDMSLTLIVRDAGGICKVKTNNEEVLRILLNKENNEWSLFRKSLKIIKRFSFKDNELEEEYPTADSAYAEFAHALSLTLHAWNEVAIHYIDLKCRKIENNETTNHSIPFWWCVEARRTYSK